MIRIRGPDQARCIEDGKIRQLVERRFEEICAGEPYDYDAHGEFIVVEPGDAAAIVEEQTGCPIVTNSFDGTQFGEDAFAPMTEWIEDHGHCSEMTFVLNDEGFGVTIIVPRKQGIDAQLLELCARFSVPEPAQS